MNILKIGVDKNLVRPVVCVKLVVDACATGNQVGGVVVVKVVIGCRYVHDYYARFLTMISDTCSIFKLG